MTTERNEKEDTAMSTIRKTRQAHRMIDDLKDGNILSSRDADLLRSFLPERPKQKTLEEISAHVYDAWLATDGHEFNGNEYDPGVAIEDWLSELHTQLKGVEVTAPAHPEFLQAGAEYQEAPWGTIVAMENAPTAWIKKGNSWSSTDGEKRTDSQFLWGVPRKVLRWGEGE